MTDADVATPDCDHRLGRVIWADTVSDKQYHVKKYYISQLPL